MPIGGKAKRVAVIGAGLAGLSCAYELARLGHNVTVLEARERAGGRVFTLRDHFSDELYAEAGAIVVIDRDKLSLDYAKQFDLPLDEISVRYSGMRLHFGGKWMSLGESIGADGPPGLTTRERSLGFWRIMGEYIGPLVREIGDLETLRGLSADLEKYDRISFAELLRQRGASHAAIRLFGTIDLTADGPESYSALGGLLYLAHYLEATHSYAVKGGNDLLARAFAARLGERVNYSVPVVSIEHDDNSVEVIVRQSGGLRTIPADYAVSTIPFSVLKRVKVTPAFSSHKQRAIRELPYASVSRVYLQSQRRFWLAESTSAQAITDFPMVIEDHTFNQPGVRGVVECHLHGHRAQEIDKLGEDDRARFALSVIKDAFPLFSENFERSASVCWDQEEWSSGAYCYFKPGQVASLAPHIAPPEGRVHFAGEHTSLRYASMEGALESGNRVAREINEAA